MEYSIWWHNLIDGTDSLEDQLAQAQWCVKAVRGLIYLESEGAIEIDRTNCSNTPSLVMWDVLDEDEYQKAQKEYGLPDGIVWEEEEE